MPDLTSARPPSSFSKYRLLPSIGTPTPPDFGEDNDDIKARTHHPNHLYNVISEPGPHKQQLHQNTYRGQVSQQPVPPHSSSGKRNSLNASGRVSSAVSDISVISARANSRSNPSQSVLSHTAEHIERLDLSKLDKETEELSGAGRRRKSSTSSSLSHTKTTKPGSGSHFQKVDVDPGSLYDGDDDDSDTASVPGYSATVSKQENDKVASTSPDSRSPPQSRRAVKKTVVVIPSPNEPAVSEILLAVKLPTDGTRHQRYFRTNEKLQAIVEYAEEVAGQDFGGYILVATAPKNIYKDLDDTIEDAGLEDKTVLHLEENDWCIETRTTFWAFISIQGYLLQPCSSFVYDKTLNSVSYIF